MKQLKMVRHGTVSSGSPEVSDNRKQLNTVQKLLAGKLSKDVRVLQRGPQWYTTQNLLTAWSLLSLQHTLQVQRIIQPFVSSTSMSGQAGTLGSRHWITEH